MRGAGYLLVCSCVLAIGTARPLAAEPPAPASPASPDPAVDASLLERSAVVVVGRVAWLRAGVGGAQHVARIDVEKALRGDPGGDAVVVFVAGPSARADHRLRGRLEGERGRRSVFFLSRTPRGSGYEIEALFSAEGPEGAEKAKVLEDELAFERAPDPDERRRKEISYHLDLLAKGRSWGRLHASARLLALSDGGAEGFPGSAAAEVSTALARAASPVLRERLERLLERLPAKAVQGGAAPADASEVLRRRWKEAEDDEARVTALTTLARAARDAAVPDLLDAARDPCARVRERAAVLLGDLRSAEGVRALVDRFAAEEDLATREAVVRAVGLSGAPASVPWLAQRLEDAEMRRPALYALARVGDAEAWRALAAAREAALRSDPPDRAAATLVDYLRGPGFRDAERTAGRVVPEPPGRPDPDSDATPDVDVGTR